MTYKNKLLITTQSVENLPRFKKITLSGISNRVDYLSKLNVFYSIILTSIRLFNSLPSSSSSLDAKGSLAE